MAYKFSQSSLERLDRVHPGLIACVVLALYKYATIDFSILEGKRTLERQKELMEKGKSWTINSKHLIQQDGFCHAVDLAPWVYNTIPWDDWQSFEKVAISMKAAALELDLPLVWGGDWPQKDGPHFEL